MKKLGGGASSLSNPQKLLAVLMSIVLAVGLCPIPKASQAWAEELSEGSAETLSSGVGTYDDLTSAIAGAQAGDTITLSNDIELGATLEITKQVTIEGTYSLKASESFSGNPVISVTGTGDLTLKSVTVDANSKARAIVVRGGRLTLDNAKVTGGNAGSSYISGIYMTGKSILVTNNSEISGNAVPSNYANDNYLQYASDLWIGSEAKGVMTGGSVGSLFVNANEYSKDDACFTLVDGVITSAFVEYDKSKTAQLMKNGGTIASLLIAQDNAADNKHSNIKELSSAENGSYCAGLEGPALAKVGNQCYATIKDAVDAASENSTVNVLSDITLPDARVDVGKNLTIDLGGHTVWSTDKCGNGSVFNITAGEVSIKNGTLNGETVAEVAGNTTTSAVGIDDGICLVTVRSGATLNLNDANLSMKINSKNGCCMYPFAGGKVNISAGKFENTTDEIYQYKASFKGMVVNQANVKDQLIRVTGGTYVGNDPQLGDDSWSEGSFVDQDYVAIEDPEGTFTVVEGYVVTFDTDSGAPAVKDQRIAKGGKVTEPTGVEKEGYALLGWYNGDAKWNFETDTVEEAVKLKAKWAELYKLSGSAPAGHGTVSLQVDGNDAEQAYEGQQVKVVTSPNTGYVLDTLTVTYGDDDSVTEVELGDDGVFAMPAGKVTATATFKVDPNYRPYTPTPTPTRTTSVTLSSTSFTYNGSRQVPTVTNVTYGGTSVPASSYDVTFPEESTDAGTYTVRVTPKSGVTSLSAASATYTIAPANLAGATVETSASEFTYDGQNKVPTVTAVKLGDFTVPASEYAVTAPEASAVAGNYELTVAPAASSKNFTGSKAATYKVAPLDLSKATVTLTPATFDLDGQAHVPQVAVYSGAVAIPASDYAVAYEDDKSSAAGTYKVTVSPKTGNVTGEGSATYAIVDKKAAADKEAADAATAAINAMDASSEASVEAARAAYEKLTADQKALVPASALKKLADAEAALSKPTKGAEIDDVAVSGGTADVKVTGASTVTLSGVTAKPGSSLTVNTVVIAGKAYKVTAIAKNAFRGTSAKSVTIGKNVKSVGASAFANAKQLTTVKVGKNVTSIGASAFSGASKLKTLTLGKSVKKVGKNALKGTAVKTVKVKSAKLTKTSLKNLVKGSKVKTVKLSGVSAKAKAKYKKWAPKGVTVK